MSLIIRDATRADLPALSPMLPLTAAYERALDEIQAHPDHRIVVAELNGDVAGTMQLSYLPGL